MKSAKKKYGNTHPSKTSLGGPPSGGLLRGWKAIADHLAQPASTARLWAKEGMPVRREGRSVVADSAELSDWLGREARTAGAVTIANPGENLIEDLRRGLSAVRRSKRKAS